MTSFLINARLKPGAAALIRFLFVLCICYGVLYLIAYNMEKKTLTHEAITQSSAKALVRQSKIQIEFDRYLQSAALQIYLSEKPIQAEGSPPYKATPEEIKVLQKKALQIYQSKRPYFQKISIQNPYRFEEKSAESQEYALQSIDDFHEHTQKKPAWLNAKHAFYQSVILMLSSIFALLLLVGLMGWLRSISIYPRAMPFFRGFVVLFFVIPFALVAILPDPFTSLDSLPGASLLALLGTTTIAEDHPLFFMFRPLIFVMSFAGICSQLGLHTLLNDSPEENLNFYRGRGAWVDSIRLSIARAAHQLQPSIPFFVIAVLFCRARMGEGHGLAVLINDAANLQTPLLSYQALILFIAVIIFLTIIGKFFLRSIYEAVIPINADEGVR